MMTKSGKRNESGHQEGVLMTEIRKKEGKWSPRRCLDARNPEKRRKVVTKRVS
ncbi:hypothetical protein [Bacillus sp. OK048]|uniref:hypothetical protein n=1 Tax=Bacillus sp. OK048 TaxID=1882761 RepID=UPI00158756B6|nr:hypothetical protein [Bacillus sp. OK048]